MSRDEMLNKLHSIHVGVSMVALTSEGALECTCVTPFGSSYEWMDLNDWAWPVYELLLPPELELQEIRKKISKAELLQNDIAKTELESLYLSCISEDERTPKRLNAFLSELVLFVTPQCGSVYVLFNGKVANFFSEYEALEKAFSEYWRVTPWENYSDVALAEMLARIENGYDKIPILSFAIGNEE